MTFMPMQDNPMGGRNRLEDLAKLLLSSQQSQQPENSGVPTARVGGMDLLVNHTGANWGAVDNPLVGLAKGYLSNHEAQKKDQFMQGVQQVIQHPGSPDEKIGQLHVLLAQHGGNDYGLGLKDIIGQYDKSATRNILESRYANKPQENKSVVIVDPTTGETKVVPGIPGNSRVLKGSVPSTQSPTPNQVPAQGISQPPEGFMFNPNYQATGKGVPYLRGSIKNSSTGTTKSNGDSNATDSQRTTSLYAQRIKQANDVFDKLDGYLSNLPVVGTKLNEMAPNFMKAPEFKNYEQAQRNFLNAALRRESGAVISDDEKKDGKLQYFPQPGDDPQTLSQKKANRDLVMKNLIQSSGAAYTPYEGQQGNIGQTKSGNKFRKL